MPASNSYCLANVDAAILEMLDRVHSNLTLDSDALALLVKMMTAVCNWIASTANLTDDVIDAECIQRIIQDELPSQLSSHARAEAAANVLRLLDGLLKFEIPLNQLRTSVSSTREIIPEQDSSPTVSLERERKRSTSRGQIEKPKATARKEQKKPRKISKKSSKKSPKRGSRAKTQDVKPTKSRSPKKKKSSPKRKSLTSPKVKSVSKRKGKVSSTSPAKTQRRTSKSSKSPAEKSRRTIKPKSTTRKAPGEKSLNFLSAIKKLLPIVHNKMTLSKDAAEQVNSMLKEILGRISGVAEVPNDVTSKKIEAALAAQFPKLVAEHAQSAGDKDVNKYSAGLITFNPLAKKRKSLKEPGVESTMLPSSQKRTTKSRKATSEKDSSEKTPSKRKRTTATKVSPKRKVAKRSKVSPEEIDAKSPPTKRSRKESPIKASRLKKVAPKRPRSTTPTKESPKRKVAKKSKPIKKSPRSVSPTKKTRGKPIQPAKTEKAPKQKVLKTVRSSEKKTTKPSTSRSEVAPAKKSKKAETPSEPRGRKASSSTERHEKTIEPDAENLNFTSSVRSLLCYMPASATIDDEAASFISDFLMSVCDNLVGRAADIARSNGSSMLSTMEIYRSVNDGLPSNLADHAVAEGGKMALEFTNDLI